MRKERRKDIFVEFLSALKLRILIFTTTSLCYITMIWITPYLHILGLLAPQPKPKTLNSANTIKLDLSRNFYRGILLRRFDNYHNLTLPCFSRATSFDTRNCNSTPHNSLCLRYLHSSYTLT